MKKIILIQFLLLVALYSEARELRIGLFYANSPTRVTMNYNVGRYSFFSENKSYNTLSNKTDKIVFIAEGDKVTAYYNNKTIGTNTWFRLEKNSEQNSLTLTDGKTTRPYQGNFVVYSIKGKIKIVNEIAIDKYVEGVIKGEAGYGYELEYYKVQAVISRTYALHHQKHKNEGFDLCDHTHCQVYKGINDRSNISDAVNQTAEEVLVDSSLNYINTLFHSNCGGNTVTTDFVWSKRLPCMESVKDTFCLNSSQAKWKKTVSKSSWISFLAAETKKPTSYFSGKKLNFEQTDRKEFYGIGNQKIRLVNIRQKYRLKSTYFSVYEIGNQIVLIGRGYGHGVGLCQEGGIVMSKTHSYRDILYFYYQDVSIMNISKVEYYRLF